MGKMKHLTFKKETGKWDGEISVGDFIKNLQGVKYFGIVSDTNATVLFDNVYVTSEVYCRRNILANLANPCHKSKNHLDEPLAKSINESLHRASSEIMSAICSSSTVHTSTNFASIYSLLIAMLIIH